MPRVTLESETSRYDANHGNKIRLVCSTSSNLWNVGLKTHSKDDISEEKKEERIPTLVLGDYIELFQVNWGRIG